VGGAAWRFRANASPPDANLLLRRPLTGPERIPHPSSLLLNPESRIANLASHPECSFQIGRSPIPDFDTGYGDTGC
jgi:hypothetical protein